MKEEAMEDESPLKECWGASLHLVEDASAQQDQMQPRRESCTRAQTVVEQMNTLVPSLQEGDPFIVLAFLSTY